mgnify:FL=1
MLFYTLRLFFIIYNINSVLFIMKIISIYIINLINTIKTSEYAIISLLFEHRIMLQDMT